MRGFKKGKDNPNYGKDLSGPNNARWRGGRIIRSDGYIQILKRDHSRANTKGYVYEHILVKEKEISRSLNPWEIVHHKNGNPSDNRPDNLDIIDQSRHTQQHKIKDMTNRSCFLCGSRETDKEVLKSGLLRPHWYIYKDNFICKKCRYSKRLIRG